MNQVNLVGRMVYEPETKTTKNGNVYLPLRIAVNRNDANKTADFINCRAWFKAAEFIKKYFHKGDPIEITGKLQVDSYERQDGTKVNETYVYVTEAGFVIAKKNSQETPAPQPAPKSVPGVLLTADTDEIIGDLAGAANELPFQI